MNEAVRDELLAMATEDEAARTPLAGTDPAPQY
jgi:hypothetical protein